MADFKFIEQMYEVNDGKWSYSYLFGVLEAEVRRHLRHRCDHVELAAFFAVLEMADGAYLDAVRGGLSTRNAMKHVLEHIGSSVHLSPQGTDREGSPGSATR